MKQIHRIEALVNPLARNTLDKLGYETTRDSRANIDIVRAIDPQLAQYLGYEAVQQLHELRRQQILSASAESGEGSAA